MPGSELFGGQQYHGGRPSRLAEPGFVDLFAARLVDGAPNAQLSEEFDVSPSTVKVWKRDPRVLAAAQKLIEDRVVRVTRKTDSEIENRLANAADLTVKELLEIRKEYLGGRFRKQIEGVDAQTTNEAMERLEENPELAAELQAMVERADQKD